MAVDVNNNSTSEDYSHPNVQTTQTKVIEFETFNQPHNVNFLFIQFQIM